MKLRFTNLSNIVSYEGIFLIAIILFSTIITLPSYMLGTDFTFQNHDLTIHLVRLLNVKLAFQEGTLMPNWNMYFTGGLGSPVFLLNWFIPYYIGVGFVFLGFDLVTSVKLVFLLSYLVSGVSMYILIRSMADKFTAGMATTLFLWGPYRLSMIFIRGSFGETIGLALLPLILYFVWIYQGNYKRIAISIVLALIVCSHNVLALFAAGMSVFWLMLPPYNKKDLQPSISGLIGGVLLSSFFWLPAIVEKQYTKIHLAQNWYKTQFLELYDLLFSPWRYGPAEPTKPEISMSFQLGWLHVFLFTISLLFLWKKKELLSHLNRKVLTVSCLLFIISLLLQLYWFSWIWDMFPFLTLLIFPWRLQNITLVSMVIIIAQFLYLLPHKKILLFLTLIVVPIFYRNLLVTAVGEYASDTRVAATQWHDGSSMGEFLPINANHSEYLSWFSNPAPPTTLVVPTDHVTVLHDTNQSNTIELNVDVEKPSTIVLNQYYFPGWQLFRNGKKIDINSSFNQYNGRISFYSPAGKYNYLLVFSKTPIRVVTGYISLFALLGLCFATWKEYQLSKK